MDFQRANQRFISTGLDLNHPVDLIPSGGYPFLKNVRSYQEGRMESRTGLSSINGTPTTDLLIHSGTRLNDYLAGSFLRYLGIGTSLYTGQTTFTALTSGFSGNPISFVPYLPLRSPNDYVYFADANKMGKVDVTGTFKTMGIAPPNVLPSAELAQPLYTTPSGGDATSPFETGGSWGNSGASTTPGLNANGGSRLHATGQPTTTIGTILYYSGSVGWACISASGGGILSSVAYDPSAIVAGMRLKVGSEYTTVEEVHKVYATAGVTIGAILYDSGTSGLCTVQPSSNMAGLARNTMLELGSEFVRIISVTNGPNGNTSFRCSTASTHTAGEAITTLATGNFVCYLTSTHSAGETLDQNLQEFSINPGSKGGQGSVYSNAATSTPFAMAIAGGRPLTPDDYINLSMWIDHPEYLSECNLVLDVDPATTNTHTAADGTKNAYSITFRGSNFQQFIANQQTSDAERTSAIQLDLQALTNVPLASPKANPTSLGSGQGSTPVDIATTADSNPPLPILGSATNQLYTGFSQWTEIRIKIADLLPIGMSKIADLSIIKAIILNFTTTNTIFVKMAGMWAGGTYGPDSGNNLAPFIYRYRYRNSVTGAASLPGPGMRSGITAYRQGVVLNATLSTNAQVDKIDFERLGGPNLSWNYLGTCDNGVHTLLDDQLSAAIAENSPLDTDTFQPFTLSGAPQTGLQATVSGTAISLTVGAINVNLCVGTEVLVNGVPTTVYARPSSTTLFHITESLGFGTFVNIDILEPILANQPLPAMWGPYNECLFACGNALDSGSLYFTKPQDPDSAADTNRISVTSPSEMLMNGCVFDTKAFVWSDYGRFQIIPTPGQPNLFQTDKINNSRGLASRWGLTVGPAIWFVSYDGVYTTVGGEDREISGNIQLLFPKGDRPAQAVNGINPVDLTKLILLNYVDGFLYMDYTDSTGVLRTLVCDVSAQSNNLSEIPPNSWYLDTYLEDGTGTKSVLSHYVETSVTAGRETKQILAGGNNGTLYQYGGFNDAGISISWQVTTPALNFGDSRAYKILGDVVFDTNPQGQAFTATPWINNFAGALLSSVTTLNGTSRTVSNPTTFTIDQFAQDLGYVFAGATSSAQVFLYFWEPSFLLRPENTFVRAQDWTDGGYQGAKYIRGFLVEADTGGVTKTVTLEGDYNNLQTFSMNHNGQTTKPYSLTAGQFSTLLRLVPQDQDFWRLFKVSYIYDESPELSPLIQSYTSDGYQGAKFMQGAVIEALGTSSVKVEYDGGFLGATLALDHSGEYLFAKPYVFDPPFIAHDLRLTPASAIRLGTVKWVWEPTPEFVTYWETQETTHDLPGYQFIKDMYIAYNSTAPVTLEIRIDGAAFTTTLPSTNGVYLKSYLIFPIQASGKTLKGKAFKYILSSVAPFQLFQKDCEVLVHSWYGGDYTVKQPFGDISRVSGARI